MTIFLLISLVALFYILGKAADVVVVNIKKIAEELGVRIFMFGLILGFLTSLPELAIGINAALRHAPDIALGNLLGGIIVLFSLILGGSIVINRRITIDGKIITIIPILLYLLLPLIFGMKGSITRTEGVICIVLYIALLLYLAREHHERHTPHEERHERRFMKKVFFILGGLGIIVTTAHFITKITLTLLAQFHISAFIAGLVVFSIGTNLPELIVTIRSWSKHIKELSFANLVGSAIANIFIIGLVATITPITITLSTMYYALFGFFILLSLALFFFYTHKRALTRYEGITLIAIYIAFLVTQYFLI